MSGLPEDLGLGHSGLSEVEGSAVRLGTENLVDALKAYQLATGLRQCCSSPV